MQHRSSVKPSQSQRRPLTKDCPGYSSYILHGPSTNKMTSMLFQKIFVVISIQWPTEEDSFQRTEINILEHVIWLW